MRENFNLEHGKLLGEFHYTLPVKLNLVNNSNGGSFYRGGLLIENFKISYDFIQFLLFKVIIVTGGNPFSTILYKLCQFRVLYGVQRNKCLTGTYRQSFTLYQMYKKATLGRR